MMCFRNLAPVPERLRRSVLLVLLLLFPLHGLAAPKAADLVQEGQPLDLQSKKYQTLFQELITKHHFSKEELLRIFQPLTISRKVLELMDRQWESRPYYQYARLFLTPANILAGRLQLARHRQLLDRIEKQFGVDREYIIAIWGIETRYGASQGNFQVLRTLSTLYAAYPRRSSFFGKQLVHFLLLCRENNVDPTKVMGSYAGAFGQTQFIPSSFREYAVSFDHDDRRDVWHSIPDILASIANYLKRFHWTLDAPVYVDIGSSLNDRQLVAARLKGRKGKLPWQTVSRLQKIDLPPSPDNRPLTIVGLELDPKTGKSMRYIAAYPNFQAITEWNHSNRYAMAVSELAEQISATVPVTPNR